MRFNANRLAKLAGLSKGSSTGVLREGHQLQELQNSRERDEYGEDGDYGDEMLAEGDDEDEVLEISETMLRDEIRRMREARLNESRTRKTAARTASKGTARGNRALQEARLRKEIRSEISEIFEDLQLTSKWIYGKNLPKRSAPGQVTMGIPGIGFKGSKH